MQLCTEGFRLFIMKKLSMKELSKISSLAIAALLLTVGTAHATSPEYLALVDSADNFIRHQRWMEAESTIISALRLGKQTTPIPCSSQISE